MNLFLVFIFCIFLIISKWFLRGNWSFVSVFFNFDLDNDINNFSLSLFCLNKFVWFFNFKFCNNFLIVLIFIVVKIKRKRYFNWKNDFLNFESIKNIKIYFVVFKFIVLYIKFNNEYLNFNNIKLSFFIWFFFFI